MACHGRIAHGVPSLPTVYLLAAASSLPAAAAASASDGGLVAPNIPWWVQLSGAQGASAPASHPLSSLHLRPPLRLAILLHSPFPLPSDGIGEAGATFFASAT